MNAQQRNALLQTVAFPVFLGVVLFLPAGSLAYWQAWVYCVVIFACVLAIGLYFLGHDPALVERQMRMSERGEVVSARPRCPGRRPHPGAPTRRGARPNPRPPRLPRVLSAHALSSASGHLVSHHRLACNVGPASRQAYAHQRQEMGLLRHPGRTTQK